VRCLETMCVVVVLLESDELCDLLERRYRRRFEHTRRMVVFDLVDRKLQHTIRSEEFRVVPHFQDNKEIRK